MPTPAWSERSEELSTCQEDPPSEYLQLIITSSHCEVEGHDHRHDGLEGEEYHPTIAVSVASFYVESDSHECAGSLDESLSLNHNESEDLPRSLSRWDPLPLEDPLLNLLLEKSLSHQVDSTPLSLQGSPSAMKENSSPAQTGTHGVPGDCDQQDLPEPISDSSDHPLWMADVSTMEKILSPPSTTCHET